MFGAVFRDDSEVLCMLRWFHWTLLHLQSGECPDCKRYDCLFMVCVITSLPHCLDFLHTWKCPHLFCPFFSLDPTYYRWVTSSEAWRDTCSGHTLLLEHSSTGGKLRQGVETRLARLGNTQKIQWHDNIHNFTPNIPLYLRWFLVILGLIGTSQL